MATSKEYIIQFAGLAVGQHSFELAINDRFFEDLAYSEIKQGKIIVKLTLLKRTSMMLLNFDINGTVKASCDRCAVEFDLPIQGNFELIVKIGESDDGKNDDDVVTVAASEHKLDLSQPLYEFITLSLPIKREHTTIAECDKEVIEKLNVVKVDEAPEEVIDPRWEDLKKIKLN